MLYNPTKIESKWQKRWLKGGIYEPDLKRAKRPFYNLMMFPYPSAEGLHVGNMYAFVGADIYGRLKRMQGHDVFEPMGLDGFGIHSENYAIKIGRHPVEQAKISEKNFYRQLEMIGNGFAWREKLETYDPEYYKWTQWIFTQMFKRGLAYRKKSPVNWCPSCKTVLADEQVLQGECERCGTKVTKKDLEQWFFKITQYAERLLKNLEKIDWPEPIKIAQRNWIGKSEGAEIDFEVRAQEKQNFLILHGYTGRADKKFIPWLKKQLEGRGYDVQAPQMPHTENPSEAEQVSFVLQNCFVDENTIIVGHSLGAVVAMKLLQKLNRPIAGLFLVAPAMGPSFKEAEGRPFWKNFKWDFDYQKLKNLAGQINILSDLQEGHRAPYLESLAQKLDASLATGYASKKHFTSVQEPLIVKNLMPSLKVFTTRPDTLFGATYMVLAPEHPLVKNQESRVKNLREVNDYIKKAKAETDEERIAEGKGKTGVELKGIKAVNPATKEEIPIWAADYVLGGVGTGAIMAVPAHDERDFEFAKKYNLPVKMVVCPHYPAKTCPVLDHAYVGPGHLVDSGKFSGMPFEEAKREITKFVGGERKTQYRLRDWLISRQRYWGPPIPMIFCNKCNWQPVPEKDLPIKLPYIKDFRPTGTDKSPLASVEKFYKVRCPKCRSRARRETDVSDTFLDSAWYYLRYPSPTYKKGPWDPAIVKKWFPVDMYIGGAEHAVLHLLYVRFLAMAFHDWGFTSFEEPFKKFRAHGLLIKDGAKMSKSRGNVVNPDDYIRVYGADALRMYLMFLGPFEQGGDFRYTGIRGITRFLERVWKFCQRFGASQERSELSEFHPNYPNSKRRNSEHSDAFVDLGRVVHRTIKKVTEDIENLQYNTAISALMILLNEFEGKADAFSKEDIKTFLKLLAPFAPHITEELWHSFATSYKLQATSIHKEPWPKYDPEFIREETFELVIQVNGRMRGRVTLHTDIKEDEARRAAEKIPAVKQYLVSSPRKVIFVPGRLINFVI